MSTITFCGLPVTRLSDIPPGTRVAIFGASSSRGSAHSGAENGPYFLRTLSRSLSWWGSRPTVLDVLSGKSVLDSVVDLGDIELADSDLNTTLKLVEKLVNSLPNDVVPALMGGDHTLSLPVINALRSKRSRPFSVIQFDHHLDLQIWNVKEVDGHRDLDSIFNTNVMSHVVQVIGSGRLIQIGIDPFLIAELDERAEVMDILSRTGARIPIGSPILSSDSSFVDALHETEDVYITVDVDVLSDSQMSSTGYPSPVGLDSTRLLELLNLIGQKHRIVGFDVVELAATREDRQPKTLADVQRALLIFMTLVRLSSAKSLSDEPPPPIVNRSLRGGGEGD